MYGRRPDELWRSIGSLVACSPMSQRTSRRERSQEKENHGRKPNMGRNWKTAFRCGERARYALNISARCTCLDADHFSLERPKDRASRLGPCCTTLPRPNDGPTRRRPAVLYRPRLGPRPIPSSDPRRGEPPGPGDSSRTSRTRGTDPSAGQGFSGSISASCARATFNIRPARSSPRTERASGHPLRRDHRQVRARDVLLDHVFWLRDELKEVPRGGDLYRSDRVLFGS